MSRDELVAILARVKPQRIALVSDDGTTEWLAVTRGRSRWERLIDRTIADRAWAELRLCDGRGATIEVVRAAAAAEDSTTDAIAEGAAAGDPMARFAAYLTDAVKTTVKAVSAAVESTVKTLRTESRAEMTTVLEAHQDLAHNAFDLRAADAAALAVERDRRLQLEAEVADLRAQLTAQAAPDPNQAAADRREAMILSLLPGGAGGGAGGGDPSQGMPNGA